MLRRLWKLSCDEFLSFDAAFHRRKADLDTIALKVCLPKNTEYLPSEYRQNILESGTTTP